MRSRTRRARALLFLLTSSAALSPGCASPNASSDAPAPMHHHHTIDYIELPVSDMDAAKAFYGSAFGWTFTDYGPDYAGIVKHDGEGEVGGMRLEANVHRGGPLIILYSSDLEASAQAVVATGGTILVDPFDFPGGRRFHFADPAGNELAVWSER